MVVDTAVVVVARAGASDVGGADAGIDALTAGRAVVGGVVVGGVVVAVGASPAAGLTGVSSATVQARAGAPPSSAWRSWVRPGPTVPISDTDWKISPACFSAGLDGPVLAVRPQGEGQEGG